MITAIELENFKGIAARQRVDFAPLTLLFGANSAGKSSILQGLVYLHELLERGDADVDRTELGGEYLELGGFARLIHRHDANRTMTIRTEFLTPGSLNRWERDMKGSPFDDLDDHVESAWIELAIQYRATTNFRGAVVSNVTIGVGDSAEALVSIEVGPSLREGEPLYVRVNLGHQSIAEAGRGIIDDWEQIAIPETMYELIFEKERSEAGGSTPQPGRKEDAFGEAGAHLVFAVSRSRMSALPAFNEPLRVLMANEDDPTLKQNIALEQVRTFLELTVLGTTSQLAASLARSLYIGPLRTVPPRGFLFERAGRVTRWADGLAAWDLLLSDRTTLVERTNAWLTRLGAGCQVVVQQLVDARASAEELSAGHVDSTVRRVVLDTGSGTLVLPSEVGAGIAQMVPIIVAALVDSGRGLALVEQPEIHVHPALQVGLGDLFLDAAARQGRQFLIETHSEHLLLRLMRRMRETVEGTLPERAARAQPADVKVWFVEREGAGCLIRNMPLNERGDLVKAWPGGFFEEGLREVM